MVRIGNGCGFWGDNLDAPIYLAERGQLDYLTLEYLAELTMSILALQKQRDPTDWLCQRFPRCADQACAPFGSAAQFEDHHQCRRHERVRLCGQSLHDSRTSGLKGVRVAAVVGDDLFPNLGHLLSRGESFANLDTNEEFDTVRERLVSANAYLGARPIVEALQRRGANRHYRDVSRTLL